MNRPNLFVARGLCVRHALERDEAHREPVRDRKRAAFERFDVRPRATEFASEFVRAPSLRVAQLFDASGCNCFASHFRLNLQVAALVMTCVF